MSRVKEGSIYHAVRHKILRRATSTERGFACSSTVVCSMNDE